MFECSVPSEGAVPLECFVLSEGAVPFECSVPPEGAAPLGCSAALNECIALNGTWVRPSPRDAAPLTAVEAMVHLSPA